MKMEIVFLAMCFLCINACARTESADSLLGSLTAAKPGEIIVYRSPTCGCCKKWMAHVEANHFKVTEIRTGEVQKIKDRYGISQDMASCHTAIVDGYVIEGHVPIDDIQKLLKTRPKIIGITVPGMPIGTSGMEMGDEKEAFDVLSFDRDKHYQVFNSYKGN